MHPARMRRRFMSGSKYTSATLLEPFFLNLHTHTETMEQWDKCGFVVVKKQGGRNPDGAGTIAV
jgi:hypothetical protein